MSIAEKLVSKSTLTRKQLDTLELQRRVMAGEISSSNAAEMRSRGPVSIGSYYRVLGQAKGKIRASILTVLAAMQLGYVKYDELSRLLELVGKAPTDLAGEDADRLMGVLNALLDRLVM